MTGAANDLNISENGFQSFNNTNGVFHGRTLTAGTGITITNGDGLVGDPVIGLTGAAPITAIQGDVGAPVSGPTISLFGSSGSANAGGSVVFGSSSATELDLQLTDSDGNTFLGESAGNNTLVGSGNTSVGQSSSQSIIGASATTACGFEALQDNVSGNLNTAFGFRALTSNTGGVSNVAVGGGTLQSSTVDSFNVAIGDLSLFALDGGDQNTCVGGNSGVNLDTGQFNIMLGYNAGSSLVGAESSNILFGNPGIISESNAIRIGQQGSGPNQQDACFIAGINGVTTSNSELVTIDSSTGQLGTLATANNGVLSTSSSGVPSIDTTNFSVLTTGLQLKGNNTNTAPPAGFIGEIITSSASAVAMANGVDTDITSISLTAGIWDIEGSLAVLPTGGAGVGTQEWVQITTTSATISGNAGIDHNRAVFTAFNLFSLNAPKVRATLNATTTYYLVGTHNYTSITGPGNGIISATRVG